LRQPAGHFLRQTHGNSQIAPTILTLLGLKPSELQAVRVEGT
jgi:hypothetical protein